MCRRGRIGAGALVAMLVAKGAVAQEVHTDLPGGLSFTEVLLASGLPLDAADTAGWSSQTGGSRQVGGVNLYHSVLEVSIRLPGVGVDGVRTALERTLRSELEARGMRIVERPDARDGAALPVTRGDSRTLRYGVPGASSLGWVTLLVLPDRGDRVRVTLVSIEAGEDAG